MPGDPDLRTAAQALLDALEAEGVVPWHVDAIDNAIEAVRAALAVEATEPPPDTPCDCCGHQAMDHVTGGPGAGCHRRVDVEEWCPCTKFEQAVPAPVPQAADEPTPAADAVNLRVLAAGIAAGKPLAEGWPEKLREIAARLFERPDAFPELAAAVGSPDEPTDDDLTAENWWLRQALAQAAKDFGKERAKRFEIAGKLRDALAEVERLRGAAPASEDDDILSAADFEHYRKAPGALYGTAIPPLSEDMRRAAYEQCQAIVRSHEALQARVGSPPPTPAPTRGDVRDEVSDVLGPWLANPDAEQQEDMEAAIDAMTDRVMALLSTQPAPPLWTGHTKSTRYHGLDAEKSEIPVRILPVPPGTAVEVREAPTDG